MVWDHNDLIISSKSPSSAKSHLYDPPDLIVDFNNISHMKTLIDKDSNPSYDILKKLPKSKSQSDKQSCRSGKQQNDIDPSRT